MGHALKEGLQLSQLAGALGLEWRGVDRIITGVASLNEAGLGDLTFSKSGNLPETALLAIVIHRPNESQRPSHQAAILAEDPRFQFIRALEFLSNRVGVKENDVPPQIHDSVKIGRNVVIEKGVTVGAGTIIEHNAVLLSGTVVGENCLIRSGAQIGGDGFGFERATDGTPVKFIHLGGVHIGNNVEVGSNTCIAKGTLSNTIIENDAKIDNLVHIAHNVQVRKGAFIIAGAEVSGGCELGEFCWIGPNAALIQKVRIGHHATVGIGAIVTKDVPDYQTFAGNPAQELSEFVRLRKKLKNLDSSSGAS